MFNFDRTKPEPIESYTKQDCEECLKHYSLCELRAASVLNRENVVSRDPQMNRLQKLVARRDLVVFEAAAIFLFLAHVDGEDKRA